jgi:hypothetical protein
MDDSGKDEAGQALGRKGGAARREKLPLERRSQIARAAAAQTMEQDFLTMFIFAATIEAEKMNMDGERDRCNFSGQFD